MARWKVPRSGIKRCSALQKLNAVAEYSATAFFVVACLYQQNLLGFGCFEVVHAARAVAGQIEGHEFIAEFFEFGRHSVAVLECQAKLIGGDFDAGNGVVVAHPELQKSQPTHEAFGFVEDAQFVSGDPFAVLDA